MKQKSDKAFFFSMLLRTLGANLLRNLLTGKGTIRAGECTIRADERGIRAGHNFQFHLMVTPHH